MSGEIFLGVSVSVSSWLDSDLISDSSHLFYVASLISWKEKKKAGNGKSALFV